MRPEGFAGKLVPRVLLHGHWHFDALLHLLVDLTSKKATFRSLASSSSSLVPGGPDETSEVQLVVANEGHRLGGLENRVVLLG